MIKDARLETEVDRRVGIEVVRMMQAEANLVLMRPRKESSIPYQEVLHRESPQEPERDMRRIADIGMRDRYYV